MSAPALVPRESFPSRCVKRCVRCRVVRGNTAFYHGPRYGYSADVCRFCNQATIDERKAVRAKIRYLPHLRRTERRLMAELDRVRAEIQAREAAAIALEQNDLFKAGAA